MELSARLPKEIGEPLTRVAARSRGGALADVVASALLRDAAERREVLEEIDVQARLLMVLDAMTQVLARLKTPQEKSLRN